MSSPDLFAHRESSLNHLRCTVAHWRCLQIRLDFLVDMAAFGPIYKYQCLVAYFLGQQICHCLKLKRVKRGIAARVLSSETEPGVGHLEERPCSDGHGRGAYGLDTTSATATGIQPTNIGRVS